MQVWGSVMPLSFFPVYCGVVLLASAAVQKLFVVSGAEGRVCCAQAPAFQVCCWCALPAGSTHTVLCSKHIPQSLPLCLALRLRLVLQENKKVQEISGNITKSIAGAF